MKKEYISPYIEEETIVVKDILRLSDTPDQEYFDEGDFPALPRP